VITRVQRASIPFSAVEPTYTLSIFMLALCNMVNPENLASQVNVMALQAVI